MLRKKPETLALFIALISTVVVMTVFIADLLLTRHRELEAGERRLQHFGMMMAEHTARSFESVDVLLRELSTDLTQNRRDWEKWDASTGWEYVAQRHSRSMPQMRDLAIFDRNGNQRFISSYFPPPRINIKDRPYFLAIQNGAESGSFGPYIGRNSGRYTYALARRIDDSDHNFNGIAFGAIEPAYLQDFCWSNRLSDDFEAVLINRKGQIIASCRPTDLSRQSPVVGALATEILFDGKLREILPETGTHRGNGLFASISEVAGFADLRILTAIPEKTLLANWRGRLVELGTLALLVNIVLFVGALLVRRQVRELAEMTDQLAASHEHLEQRVLAATTELAQRKDAAERANKAKSRFLAAASHDLRQPLHALSLFSTDLQRQLRSGVSNNLPRLAEQISTSTSLLSELLDSLLDISRLDVEGVKPDIRSFELAPIFERLSIAFRRAATDCHLTLHFRKTTEWVKSDAMMVERMLANLISNAIRYTPKGGRIMVATRWSETGLLIQVRDSGKGIAPEHQAAIFAEFYQIDNVAREQDKGLGLGLSIVDRLARALQINITLRSRLGAGTTFSLLVPRSSLAERKRTGLTLPLPPSGAVHFIGNSPEIKACMELARHWHFVVTTSPTELPAECIIIVDEPSVASITPDIAGDHPLVALLAGGSQIALPAGIHRLPIPLRPAKLRAILNQLQKTFEKSMP